MQYNTYIIIILSLLSLLPYISTTTITPLLNYYPIINSTGSHVSALGYDSTSQQIVTNINNPLTNWLLILTPTIVMNSSLPVFTFS